MGKKSFESKVKDIVQMELNDEIEDKNSVVGYSDQALNAGIPSGIVFNSQGNFFQILPPIRQSTSGEAGRAYNERVGNEIMLKEIDIHGALSYNYSLASQVNYQNSKLAVRVMILRAKTVNDVSILFDNMPTDKLIRFGNYSSLPLTGASNFAGSPLDAFRDINRETFSVRYDKVHYLNAPVISPGTDSVDLALIPSTTKIFREKLRFGKKGLKLKFDDNTDTVPNNFPYFMVIGYSGMAGLAVPANGLARITMSCVGSYTDA